MKKFRCKDVTCAEVVSCVSFKVFELIKAMWFVLSPYIRKISIEIPVSDSLLDYFLFWCVLQEFQSYFNFSLIDSAGTQLLGPFYSPSAHAKATNTNSSSSPSCSPISNLFLSLVTCKLSLCHISWTHEAAQHQEIAAVPLSVHLPTPYSLLLHMQIKSLSPPTLIPFISHLFSLFNLNQKW
jgi:hypothetical protein